MQRQHSSSNTILIVGSSVTGGGGVKNDLSQAWHAFLDKKTNKIVHFKNAISPCHFLSCSSQYQPKKPAKAVLLDFGPSLFSTNDVECLASLVRTFGNLAATSNVALIPWPRRSYYKSDTRHLENAAKSANAPIITIEGVDFKQHYAMDGIHPNLAGHQLIAKNVNKFLASQHLDTTIAERSPIYANSMNEVCISDARNLPVVKHDGWNLVDHGRYNRSKFGWYTIGVKKNELVLAVENPFKIKGLVFDIGYLSSMSSGIFKIKCSPCLCTSWPSYWRLYPFPIVYSKAKQNMSVSLSTKVLVTYERRKQCNLSIMALGTSPVGNVRIDSLNLLHANAYHVHKANKTKDKLHAYFVKHALQQWTSNSNHTSTHRRPAVSGE